MISNGTKLWLLSSHPPIKDMATTKLHVHGTSYGLTEAGYDIRIKQKIIFKPQGWDGQDVRPTVATVTEEKGTQVGQWKHGRFTLASAMEEFDMPANLMGIVHDKSTWARRGLSVFNTVIEPGWKGFLTLELVYHGEDELIIPAGSGIAQVIFHQLSEPANYVGKYQNQGAEPTPALHGIGTTCPICGAAQFLTPSGVTCPHGHLEKP